MCKRGTPGPARVVGEGPRPLAARQADSVLLQSPLTHVPVCDHVVWTHRLLLPRTMTIAPGLPLLCCNP